MACSCNHGSSCSSCCNRSCSRVSCANRSSCGWNNWNNWNGWNGWNNWNGWNWNRSGSSSCNSCNNCSSCCGCNSCNHCHNSNHCGSCSSCCENWNCGRSGCGSTRNSFGLLRGVAGPYNCIIGGLRYPFYTGPCGPCACDCCNNGCNSCDNCCDNCCDDDCCDSCADCCDSCGCTNATFAAATPVELSAGDAVELSCTTENSHDFTATRDGIRIHRAGSYMVVYTVNVPAKEAVSSRFILTLNGDRIAATAADVASPADGSTGGCTMHTTLYIPADSLLKLISLSPVSICQSPASNVFTLSLHRMED